MSGTDQGSRLPASGPRIAQPGGAAPCLTAARRTRFPNRLGLLALAITLSGSVITALVYSLGQARARGASVWFTGTAQQPQTASPALIWWGFAIIAGCGAALLLLKWRRHRLRSVSHTRVQAPFQCSRVRQILELSLERSAAATEAESWTALLGVVELLQHELDAYYNSGASAPLLNVQARCASPQHILNALPVGVLQVDAAGHVQYANPSATALLQLRNEDGQHTRLEDQLAQPALVEAILNLRHHMGGAAVDCRFDAPGGPVVARLSAIAPGPGRDDLLVLVQDISELKQAERTRDEFLAHLTHELRTPLTNIQAYAETLNDDFFDDEKTRRECYNVIMAEARRLAKLIEDVLSVSQIDAGAARLTRSPVRVDDLLREAAREVQSAADAKGIELALDIPPHLPALHGDRFRLQQVWTNLLNNAIKFTPPGGAVKAAIEADQRVMRLCVADTGIGIAPRWQKLIFEKFFRVQDPVVLAAQGTGLGLALVRDIVRLHGGSIQVESTPGAGTRFTVELPITAWTAQAPVTGRSASEST
jgi:signal transduction histidine kinase